MNVVVCSNQVTSPVQPVTQTTDIYQQW